MGRNNSYWCVENGVKDEYGLTEKGIAQAKDAGVILKERLAAVLDTVVVIASPFSRAVQTAVYASEALGIQEGDPNFRVAHELRERYFGTTMELGDHAAYKDVWARDAIDINDAGTEGGESVADLVIRVRKLLEILEQKSDQNIILVSHGDTLSVAAALLSKTDVSEHRQYGMKNCEIKEFPKGE